MTNIARATAALALASLLHLGAANADAQSVADHPRVRQAVRVAEIWLDAQRDYEQIPGLSAAIVHDQETIWSGGFGYADLERRSPATAETVYSICSISKLFTSVALMQLRDAGKLRLDDPVAQHLDWFDLRQAHPGAPEITVEGILTHSAGLPREANSPYWSGPDFVFPTREEIVAGLREQETLYPAASIWQYSNLGLTLAGEIVAELSGESYDAYVRSNVLQPLGLASTFPEMPEALRGGRLATGYGFKNREGERPVLPFYLARGIAPAAGYASTAEDLARFAAWQFRLLDDGAREEVLRPNTLKEMQRVHWVDPDFETHWGLGFSVWRDGDETYVGHGGSCPGYRTMLTIQPGSEIATVVMANAMINPNPLAQRLHDLIAPAVAFATDTTRKPVTPDASLQPYLGRYDDAPWGGETAVVEWEGGLAMLSLPTANPARALTKIRKVEGEHTFRRVRDDGSLAEPIVFEIGPDGRATRYWQHNNPSPRLPDR